MWYLRWVGAWRGRPIPACHGASGKHRLKVRTPQHSIARGIVVSMECRHCSRTFWLSQRGPNPKGF